VGGGGVGGGLLAGAAVFLRGPGPSARLASASPRRPARTALDRVERHVRRGAVDPQNELSGALSPASLPQVGMHPQGVYRGS